MELHVTYIVCHQAFYGEDDPLSDNNPVTAQFTTLDAAVVFLNKLADLYCHNHEDLHAEWVCVSSQVPCRLRLVQDDKKTYMIYSITKEPILI